MRLSPNISVDPEAPRSLWADAFQRLLDNRLALFGLGFFVFISALCYLGPFVYRLNPDSQVLALDSQLPFANVQLVEVRYDAEKATPDETTTLDDFVEVYAKNPEADLAALAQSGTLVLGDIHFRTLSRFHLLGTDSKGRDILARIMRGGRISLGVAFLATLTALVIGVNYGLISGYFGGRVDALMMRVVDILYALPFLIFVILLMILFDGFRFKILLVFIAIGAVEWLTMARIVRGQVLHLKEQDFVAAARATGVKTFSILTKHLAPNLLGPVIVYSTLLIPAVMLLESTLSFLGLGMQANMASWGTLIKEGQESMRSAPWQLIAPSLFFSATLFAMNFLGDGLRDALDVKSDKD
ncbi:ABC transporter permease [Pelagicoccus mobilis]|uniref:Oligopeptide transport system permease protein OppC n=1 Tax=Pelagicoccus mobilis TaxID=415221 RepID=A0A934RZY6_9BACT|nr:ABC transporter permease [Pelagicoccus mobilis]MBK1877996.1 ABC transporter permease [Pelagicoccus mobilis]